MLGANQLQRLREDVLVTADDLLAVPTGDITEAGLRQNLNVGVSYLEAWLNGSGCVPLFHLMEDAATAEISRIQIWQWLHHGASLDDGQTIDEGLVKKMLGEELALIRHRVGARRYAAGRFELAADLFLQFITADELDDFLTLAAYEHL